MKPIEYYLKNKDIYLKELMELVKIPSVSFPGHDPKHVEASAAYVQTMFKRYGIEETQVLKYKGPHPYVIAKLGHDPKKKTFFLYAHHDVQPTGDLKKWKSGPFEPVVREGRLWGRGSADDKAGVLIHLAAIDAFLKTKQEIPVNLVVLIEGEEEVGSSHLEGFLKDHRNLFGKLDGVVLTDTMNFDSGIPALTIALRGLVSVEVELKALKQSVHSGVWGGPLPDPAMALSKILAKLVDDQGRIQIPDLYSDIEPPSEKSLKAMKNLPLSEETFRKQSGLLPGVKLLKSDNHFIESIWYQPALSVNAIQASSRALAGNIICDSAWAKVGIRIVPNMNAQKTLGLLKSFLEKNTPWGCQITVKPEALAEPWRTHTDHPVFEIAMGALKDGYDGKETVIMGCGASIPFAAAITEGFGGIPALLVGVEDPFTNAHSENESLLISDFEKSIKSQIYLFERLSKLSK